MPSLYWYCICYFVHCLLLLLLSLSSPKYYHNNQRSFSFFTADCSVWHCAYQGPCSKCLHTLFIYWCVSRFTYLKFRHTITQTLMLVPSYGYSECSEIFWFHLSSIESCLLHLRVTRRYISSLFSRFNIILHKWNGQLIKQWNRFFMGTFFPEMKSNTTGDKSDTSHSGIVLYLDVGIFSAVLAFQGALIETHRFCISFSLGST